MVTVKLAKVDPQIDFIVTTKIIELRFCPSSQK